MKDISKMNIEELVHLVNSALGSGVSVNRFCSNNGLKGSTVKTKLRRGGYTYNNELRAYVKSDADTKDNIKSDTENSVKDEINTNTKIKELELQVLKLEDRLNNLEGSLGGHNKSVCRKGRHYINNTKATTTKGIRLYTEVKEQLDRYLETHKDKKIIEVFSFAILDYINKYK